MSSIGFVNTQTFRESALYWEKHRKYDDGVPGTTYHREYWKREIDRCINGYTSGGVRISGYYYHYLNYCRIAVTEKTYGEVHKSKAKNAKVVGERTEKFPDFWDVDFSYFTCVDICERGISLEEYEKIPIALNINVESLGGACHLVWLKPRGVGASWKAASMAERNYALIRGSKTYMLANDKTFLTEDGLWSKYLGMRDWQITNCRGIGKRSDFKKDRNNMHMRASIELNGVEAGYMSEVIGLSLNNDWQKARGKRGKLVLWEELGKFPNADKAWLVALRSMMEGDTVFGLMLGFGTGGTKDANFEALKTMFYDPRTYNIMLFDNVYGENRTDFPTVGMFTPADCSIQFKDKDGNSNKKEAREFLLAEREIARSAKDQNVLPRMKAEDPLTPEEAVLVVGKNIFLTDGLIKHKERVENLKLYRTIPTVGRFEKEPIPGKKEMELKFKVDETLKPVYKFPNNANDDLEGAVLLYYPPFKNPDGTIPENLYQICVDAYRHDETTGDSIGAIYVIEQLNNFTQTKGDVIAASYIGRPPSQEDFNTALFQLAEYYNAMIAFENDEPGDIIGYAKRKHKLEYLAEEFELAFDETLQSKEGGSKRDFGISMNSGKENRRKKQGDIYTKRWIYTERSRSEDGIIRYNYHSVYDLGLLQEWIDYDIDANRDRQSAFRVGMYHQQELEYKEIAPQNKRKVTSTSSFFEKSLF